MLSASTTAEDRLEQDRAHRRQNSSGPALVRNQRRGSNATLAGWSRPAFSVEYFA